MKALVTLCVLLLLASCASRPPRNAALESARATLASVGAESQLTPPARDEFRRAENALRVADQAYARRDDPRIVEQLAGIAKQRALLARERDMLERIEQRSSTLSSQRDSALAEARERAVESRRVPVEPPAERRPLPPVERRPAPPTEPAPPSDAERRATAEAARQAAEAEREARERSAAQKKPAANEKPANRASVNEAARAQRERRAASAETTKPKAPAQPPPRQASPPAKPKEAPPQTAPQTAEAPRPTEASRPAEPPAQDRTAATQSEPRDVVATAPPQASSVSLTDDFFHPGAPFLRPGATRLLDPVANLLRQHPDRKVRIQALAGRGNGELLQGRANEVRNALVRRGVPANRIQIGAVSNEAGGAPRVEVVVPD